MKISLQIKIVLFVIIGVIVGGSITFYIVDKGTSNALQKSISSNLAAATKQTSNKIDRFLYERLVDVEQVTGREQVQRYVNDPKVRTADFSAQLIRQLSDFKVLAGTWADITLVDTKENVVLTTDEPKLADKLVHQTEFQSPYTKALAGEVGYSDVILEGTSGVPIMLFMAPIRNVSNETQPIVGVLVGELAWPSTLEILKDIGGNTQAQIVNTQGKFLGDSGAEAADEGLILRKDYSNTEVFKRAQNKDQISAILPGTNDKKKQYLTATTKENGYLSYEGNNWYLIVQEPADVAFAPAKALAQEFVPLYVVALLLAIVCFLIINDFMVLRPLNRLRVAALLLAAGDFSQRIKIRARDEIGELGQSFNNMAEGLQLSAQKLHEEHARLKASIDSLDIGLLMTFREDNTISYNAILPRILGLELDGSDHETARLTLDQLGQKLLPSKVDLLAAIQNCQNQGKYFDLSEITYGTKILRIFGAPITTENHTIIGAVVLFEDITDAKILERSKDEFFSIASHELRTPLTSIKGNTSMILDYYKEVLKDDQLREMIDDVHTSAIRLIGIVNDFLDASRLEQGKMSFAYESTNIEEIIESVVYEMKAVLNEKHIYLKLDKLTLNELPPVWVDKNRLKQVVYNLVGNAAKFTEEGGITISAKLEPDHQFVKVLVIDTGRGMTPESQTLLFHKFQQASSSLLTRDTTRGTGLGLYISKMIVENMGGKVSLEESVEGKGSVFSFTLPLATHEQMTPAAPKAKTDTITVTSPSSKP